MYSRNVVKKPGTEIIVGLGKLIPREGRQIALLKVEKGDGKHFFVRVGDQFYARNKEMVLRKDRNIVLCKGAELELR